MNIGRKAVNLLSCSSVLEVSVGEMKSAWELAMEKVDRLGKLSPGELKRQKEEKYGEIAQILTDKYLSGLALWQLEVELDKYKAEEKDLVRASLASKLIQSIDLGNYERLEKVVEGISGLKKEGDIKEIKAEIEQLFQEYREVEQEGRQEIEVAARGVLHQLRISGSAIGSINHRVLPEWQQESDRFAQPYKERLEGLKGKLIELSA